MKKLSSALLASIILLPIVSFAQATPQAPASWIAFKQQESAKRIAFFKQMKEDRDAFISANPDVKAYLDEVRAARLAKREEWLAQHKRVIPGQAL